MSIATFYDPRRVQLAFGASGKYTIVKNKHIGIDQGTNRKAIDVPALLPGRVVDVIRTHSILGSVVVVDVGVLAPWGRRVYLSYCHLSKDRLPEVGARLSAGDRVGRLAAGPNKGPNAVPSWHVEYPGSSWGGIHLHLVAGFHPRSAHEEVPGHRTLQMFINPADLVWRALSGAPAGGNETSLEDDDMGTLDNTEENYQTFVTFLQRALKWDVRDGDKPGADPALGATLWDRLGRIGDRVADTPRQVWEQAIPAQSPEGMNQDVAFPARGFVASSNAQIGALREVVATLAAGQGLDPKALEEAAERGARKALEDLTFVPKGR